VTPASTRPGPYTTRILVRRPIDPKQFNGTVVVEWLNVTGQADEDPDFGSVQEELLRGYAWVGVSAQAAGINSPGPSPLGPGVAGLKTRDPTRYSTLNHPGDNYSFDIFSQLGAALEHPQGAAPLAGLHVKALLADGESQSAFRMLTYTNAMQPVANVYNGILIHSRPGVAGGINVTSPLVPAARVRTDLTVPVFQFETETDMSALAGPGPFSFPAARQPDTPTIRTWEVAGTAHADSYLLQYVYAEGIKQYGTAGFLDLRPAFAIVNNGPEHFVANAALRSLRDWVENGTSPPSGAPRDTANGAIIRDGHGNALGGVRTPQVDVPIATLTGEGDGLNGFTFPFDTATMGALFPTHGAYVSMFMQDTRHTLDGGFITPEGARQMRTDAAQSTVP
jgi:hypothetical protein